MSNFYITQVELATHFGVQKSYITKLRNQGLFDLCFEGKKLVRDCAIKAYENRPQDPTRENQREANASKRKTKPKAKPKSNKNWTVHDNIDEALEEIKTKPKERKFKSTLDAVNQAVKNVKKRAKENGTIEQDEIDEFTDENIKQDSNIYNDSNIDDLNGYLRQAKNANQKVQLIKDFWIGKINEQKYKTEQKQLIYIDDVVRENQKVIKAIRDKCLSIPSKLAPMIVSIDDVTELQQILDDAIYDALSELARMSETI